jgi:uncharacterized protein
VTSQFLPLEHYQASALAGHRLLPFRFTKLRDQRYVLTNMAGEYAVVSRAELGAFVHHRLSYLAPAYAELKSKHFLENDDSGVAQDLLALKVRTKLQHLANFTSLHIFVVTLRCEHSCPYCQVSRQSDDRVAFDMDAATASKFLDLTFRSPTKLLKIEFQGGEPLLNFDLIKTIVLDAETRARQQDRIVQFVIATNLAIVADDILEFCRQHNVLLSTSLDGPEDLHNANRPRPGRDSYRRAIDGINRARAVLGKDRVSALMTTTAKSLTRGRDIIDEYRRLEFSDIFLRPISPYGFAMKTKFFARDCDAEREAA